MRTPKHTFVSVAESLIAEAETRVKLGEAAPSLVRDYRQRLNRYGRPFFKNIAVTAIDSRKLREFREWLADQGLKASSIAAIMSFASMVLKLADEDNLIPFMPRVPRKGHKDCPRPAFSRDQYVALLSTLKNKIERGNPAVSFKGNVVDREMREIVTFMVNGFTRPGDIFALKHKHVEVLAGEGDGPACLKLTPPSSKGHDDPIITMPAAAKIYERLLTRRRNEGLAGPDDYVFVPGRSNRDYAHEVIRRQFTQVLKLAGLSETANGVPHSLYSLRHSAIQFRLLNSADLDLLTLARTCRTSVEMIDRFYARRLTAEMNREKLHSFKRESRYAA